MMDIARASARIQRQGSLCQWSRIRKPRPCVQAHSVYHFIRDVDDIYEKTNAYAVNDMIVQMTNDTHKEYDVRCFIEAFAVKSKAYYNLRRLQINAPFAVLEGRDIENIMNIPSTFTDLELNIFAFHSPKDDMWKGNARLQSVGLKFYDGIAFPNSASELLGGIMHHKKIREIRLRNESPHMPTLHIDTSLRRKVLFAHGYANMHSDKQTKHVPYLRW